MIIKSLHIYGFGKLKDTQLTLHQGINIIEGMNEAGKSTIMAFIRAIFFGFEGNRNPHLRYEPIHGGRFGGSITLVDENGQEIRIERVKQQKTSGDVQIYLANGEIKGEEHLPILLGKINDKVFKQIFSFGLTELQQLDALQDGEINDFIYHAGTGSVTQILKMKQKIEQEQSNLFKKSGKNPEINLILAEMDETRNQLDQLKNQLDEHQDAMTELKGIDPKIKVLEDRIRENNKEIDWLEKIQHYAESYLRIREINEELKEHPDPFHFPDNGVERLNHILETLNGLDIDRKQLLTKKDAYEQEISKLDYDPLYVEHEAEIHRLDENLSSYKELKKNNSLLLLELEKLTEEIVSKMNQLGSSFTEERILAIEFSIQKKQHIQELTATLEQKQKQLDDINKDIKDKRSRYKQLQEEREALQGKLSKNKESQILERYPIIKKEWEHRNNRLMQKQQFEQQRDFFDEQGAQVSGTNQSALIYSFIAILAIISIGVFIWIDHLIGGIASLMTLFFFTFAILFNNNKGSKKIGKAIQMKKSSIEMQIHTLTTEIIDREAALKETMRAFDLPEINDASLAKLEEQYQNTIRLGQIENEVRGSIERYRIEQESLEKQLKLLEEEQRNPLAEAFEGLKQEWREWLKEHYLQENLSPLVVFDTMAVIVAAKDGLRQRASIEAKVKNTQEGMGKYEETVNIFITKYTLKIYGSVEEIVYHLKNRLKESSEKKLSLQHLQSNLESLLEQLDTIDKRIAAEEEKINDLYRYAHVEHKEAFYETAKRYQRYQAISSERKELTTSIRSGLNGEDEVEKMLHQLEEVNIKDISYQLEQIIQQVKLARGEINQLLEEKGSLQNKLKQMEKDQTLSTLNQQYLEQQALLKQKTKEWLTAGFAKYLLEKTMEVYENERQPQVMQRASAYFQQMTEQKYKKIISPLGTQQIEVVRNDDVRFMPQFLSRGTVEQLFIAMRFALVEEFSSSTLLPVMIDDIFVNFDEVRLKQAISVLEKIAVHHQIIIFTCHSYISDGIKQASKQINHMSLS